MSRFRSEENVDLVFTIQSLVSEFMIKLYNYTYGDKWYLMKGEKDKPSSYDVQHLIKFLAYDTNIPDGPEYPEPWNIFRKKYKGIIGDMSRYRRILVQCLKIRNNVTGHQSEDNLNNAEGFDSFLRYANTFTGILLPFRNISELYSDNGVSYYDELQFLLKQYVSEDRYSLDTIRMDLGDQFGYISNTDILDICVDSKYGIYGDTVAASDYDRLIEDVRRELERKRINSPQKTVRIRRNPAPIIILSIISAVLAVPAGMWVYEKLNAPEVYRRVFDSEKPIYVDRVELDGRELKMEIVIENKTADPVPLSGRLINLECLTDSGNTLVSPESSGLVKLPAGLSDLKPGSRYSITVVVTLSEYDAVKYKGKLEELNPDAKFAY